MSIYFVPFFVFAFLSTEIAFPFSCGRGERGAPAERCRREMRPPSESISTTILLAPLASHHSFVSFPWRARIAELGPVAGVSIETLGRPQWAGPSACVHQWRARPRQRRLERARARQTPVGRVRISSSALGDAIASRRARTMHRDGPTETATGDGAALNAPSPLGLGANPFHGRRLITSLAERTIGIATFRCTSQPSTRAPRLSTLIAAPQHSFFSAAAVSFLFISVAPRAFVPPFCSRSLRVCVLSVGRSASIPRVRRDGKHRFGRTISNCL